MSINIDIVLYIPLPFQYWSEQEKKCIENKVYLHAKMLHTNPQIRLINWQYGEWYDQWSDSLNNNYDYMDARDEAPAVNKEPNVVKLINKLEITYLYEKRLDLNIIQQLLETKVIRNAHMMPASYKGVFYLLESTNKPFWVSLKIRLEHLLNHPEDVVVFEVEKKMFQPRNETYLPYYKYEYKHPKEVALLVRGTPFHLEPEIAKIN